jgi:small subunit ribosomal protein S8
VNILKTTNTQKMVTDPIADYLTRLRNALQARHTVVEIPASKMKKAITEILYNNGYILKYKFEDTPNHQGIIKIALKYDKQTQEPVIKGIRRVSRPGLRRYAHVDELPKVINGLGISIISTSQGLMTDKEARRRNIGGEVICEIY